MLGKCPSRELARCRVWSRSGGARSGDGAQFCPAGGRSNLSIGLIHSPTELAGLLALINRLDNKRPTDLLAGFVVRAMLAGGSLFALQAKRISYVIIASSWRLRALLSTRQSDPTESARSGYLGCAAGLRPRAPRTEK